MTTEWAAAACRIEIVQADITQVKADAIVNSANEKLTQGGGVCGAIFKSAGAEQLKEACNRLGGCRTGSAVLTPAFHHRNSVYIIHAVGPRWVDGSLGEAELLRRAYHSALELAVKKHCRNIVFPLLSAGAFGVPVQEAWKQAIAACLDFITDRFFKDKDKIDICFAVRSSDIAELGNRYLDVCLRERKLLLPGHDAMLTESGLRQFWTPFMKERVLLLQAIYHDPELRESAKHYNYEERNLHHKEVFDLISHAFNREMLLKDSAYPIFAQPLNCGPNADGLLEMNYSELKDMVSDFSLLQLLAVLSALMRHVSFLARAYEEYVFIPKVVGNGILLALFEAYLELE